MDPKNQQQLSDASSPQLREQLFLLGRRVGGDPTAQPPSGWRGAERGGAGVDGIRLLPDVSLLDQRTNNPARGALIQPEPFRELSKPQRTMFDQHFERVALRYRHVVAADAVAVSELERRE